MSLHCTIYVVITIAALLVRAIGLEFYMCYVTDFVDVAVREKEFTRKSETSDAVHPEGEKMSREMEQLSKMTDSGTAAVILKDLKKKKVESPTLDPRNASRTPSASVEPLQKPRYETPYFACKYCW